MGNRVNGEHNGDGDREVDGPLPSFWSDEQQSGWDRIKDALERDWLQTKADLGLAGGADIGQSVTLTMEQAAGTAPLPRDVEVVGWSRARQAIRLGYGAALHWSDEETWGDYVEYQLKGEWASLHTDVPWVDARKLVQRGWEEGRRDLRTHPAPGGGSS